MKKEQFGTVNSRLVIREIVNLLCPRDVVGDEIVVYQSVTSQGSVFLLAASWVIGHLIGYVVTGIALLRSKAVPWWAASLFIVGIPLQAVGYGAGLNILQLICFALIFIGSIPAARAMIKSDL